MQFQEYKLEIHNYKTIVNSVLTRSSQSASLTNTKIPGLLQKETFFHSSTIMPEVLRNVNKDRKQGELPHLYRSKCSKSMGKSHIGAPIATQSNIDGTSSFIPMFITAHEIWGCYVSFFNMKIS
jgi:hypothetical protein